MQKEKFKKRFFLFAVLTAIASISNVTTRVGTAQGEKSWKAVQAANLERNKKVRQSFLTGFMSDYKSADLRREYYKAIKDISGPDFAPIPIDTNLVVAFSWFTDGGKWRLDLRRVYPSIGQDFKQSSFDGEKFISYNEYSRTGEISGEKSTNAKFEFGSPTDLENFSSDTIVGGGSISYLEKNWMKENEFPIYEKDELVNGIPCQKYGYSTLIDGSDTKLEVWFSQDKSIILKYVARGVNAQSRAGSMAIYVADKLMEDSGTNVPSRVKLELYSVNDQKLTWRVTRIFSLAELQLNDKNSVSAFQHPVRVTARIEDKLNNPGLFKALGGDPSEEIEKVRLGTPPPLERPEAETNGTAPEVAQAQGQLERKPSDK